MSDLEEKEVGEFTSNGFKCPTCFAVMGRKCDSKLKWCATDKLKCVEFSGIVNTGTLKDAVFCRHSTLTNLGARILEVRLRKTSFCPPRNKGTAVF